jgi:hypothetical protein
VHHQLRNVYLAEAQSRNEGNPHDDR